MGEPIAVMWFDVWDRDAAEVGGCGRRQQPGSKHDPADKGDPNHFCNKRNAYSSHNAYNIINLICLCR